MSMHSDSIEEKAQALKCALCALADIPRKHKLYANETPSDEEFAAMESVADNEALPQEEKVRRLKAAKTGSWYDGWKPYCLVCNSTQRMCQTTFGFSCSVCKNMIGFNLTRLKESPLNHRR